MKLLIKSSKEFRAENGTEDDPFDPYGVLSCFESGRRMNEKEDKDKNEEEQGNEDDDEFEFSFVKESEFSPVAADEIFSNGQIRPIYPIFNRDLLSNNEDFMNGSSNSNTNTNSTSEEASARRRTGTDSEEHIVSGGLNRRKSLPEVVRRANPELFKTLEVRHLLHRSNGDGKDTRLLTPSSRRKEQSREDEN
ncbi:hypothetical protein HAX54_034192 [Datura stramonium]|uniref:Uncharacterized protein n=1 Tax=Datura stramonium TaxID=4076 RepID=A0ABS8VGC6_DATST|nr:hypothetical protein [Datura stramonium]